MEKDHSRDRYIPKATNFQHGWGIWDALEKRFVPDAELANISEDRIANEKLPLDS